MFTGWADQKRDLAALQSSSRRTCGRDRTQRLGPAYVAAARRSTRPSGWLRGLARAPHEAQLRPGGRARRRARPRAAPAADRGTADGHDRRPVRVRRSGVRGRHLALVRRPGVTSSHSAVACTPAIRAGTAPVLSASGAGLRSRSCR
jgi:hypothetical protein